MYSFLFQKGNTNFITMVHHASMSHGNNVDLCLYMLWFALLLGDSLHR